MLSFFVTACEVFLSLISLVELFTIILILSIWTVNWQGNTPSQNNVWRNISFCSLLTCYSQVIADVHVLSYFECTMNILHFLCYAQICCSPTSQFLSYLVWKILISWPASLIRGGSRETLFCVAFQLLKECTREVSGTFYKDM